MGQQCVDSRRKVLSLVAKGSHFGVALARCCRKLLEALYYLVKLGELGLSLGLALCRLIFLLNAIYL